MVVPEAMCKKCLFWLWMALATHIKPFLKNIKVKGCQCPDYKQHQDLLILH